MRFLVLGSKFHYYVVPKELPIEELPCTPLTHPLRAPFLDFSPNKRELKWSSYQISKGIGHCKHTLKVISPRGFPWLPLPLLPEPVLVSARTP